MASSPFLRSSGRKSEGLITRSKSHSSRHHNNHNNSHNNNAPLLPQGNSERNSAAAFKHVATQPNIGRKKRPRDEEQEERESLEHQKKKARFAIELPALVKRPKNESTTFTSAIMTTATAPAIEKPKTRSVGIVVSEHEEVNQKVTKTLRKRIVKSKSPSPPQLVVSKRTAEIATATQTEPPSPPQKKINHHEKVVNGIKHELDRLQPDVNDLKVAEEDGKRKLRSQENAWFKSELSAYLPEYDLVIGNIPKEEHILDFDTPIIIVDSAKTTKTLPQPRKTNGVHDEYPLKEFPEELFTILHDAQKVDFSFMDKNWKEEGGEDPLSDEYFETIHRKPERLEKSIRNLDKGRAQHEKDQVMRLLEGLQGHDWLKLMGVSGVTESKKKEYEPAREYFITGCKSLVEKFRWWRSEERRRKLEREAALAEAEAEAEEEEENEEEAKADEEMEEDEVEAEEEIPDDISDGDPPDYDPDDASAARQLHEEAIARSAPQSKAKYEPSVHEVQKDFTSFFKKPHLREAALGRTRRSGRSAAAWGHPVPEVTDTDFDLPEEYRDECYLKTRERRKRRDRRVSKT